jgi:hypothetical protein
METSLEVWSLRVSRYTSVQAELVRIHEFESLMTLTQGAPQEHFDG